MKCTRSSSASARGCERLVESNATNCTLLPHQLARIREGVNLFFFLVVIATRVAQRPEGSLSSLHCKLSDLRNFFSWSGLACVLPCNYCAGCGPDKSIKRRRAEGGWDGGPCQRGAAVLRDLRTPPWDFEKQFDITIHIHPEHRASNVKHRLHIHVLYDLDDLYHHTLILTTTHNHHHVRHPH